MNINVPSLDPLTLTLPEKIRCPKMARFILAFHRKDNFDVGFNLILCPEHKQHAEMEKLNPLFDVHLLHMNVEGCVQCQAEVAPNDVQNQAIA